MKEKIETVKSLRGLTQTKTMKPFEELTYTDNFLFGEVMQDETTSKNVLEIILGVKIKQVVIAEKEKHIDNIPDRKSIRLDIYLEDDESTVYNIEMQVDDKKDTPKRSRYYQGLMDVKSLPSGTKDYNQLKKSFVIFICLFDPFGHDRCFYTFEERCIEDLILPLGDETRKIFLNASGKKHKEISNELQEFLDYIKDPSTTIKSQRIKDLDNRVKKIKADAEARLRYMTLMNWIEEERDDARAEGRAEGLAEGRAEGLTQGEMKSKIELIRRKYIKDYNSSKTAEALEIDENFVADIYQLFQDNPEDEDVEIAKKYMEQIDGN